eukprot:GHVU01012907.1.p1 GENE.GHVU01012907.1~~GHVU01012907.1.p1  ORF type:complete len:115 (-),score=3.79 GHVU01012907.1:338-682(-)
MSEGVSLRHVTVVTIASKTRCIARTYKYGNETRHDSGEVALALSPASEFALLPNAAAADTCAGETRRRFQCNRAPSRSSQVGRDPSNHSVFKLSPEPDACRSTIYDDGGGRQGP